MNETIRQALQEVLHALTGTEEELQAAIQRAPLMVRWTAGGAPRSDFTPAELVLRALGELRKNPHGPIEHCRNVSMEVFSTPPPDGDLRAQIKHLVELALKNGQGTKSKHLNNVPPIYVDEVIERAEKCPHCNISAVVKMCFQKMYTDIEGVWRTRYGVCPSCQRIFVYLRREVEGALTGAKEFLVWPQNQFRAPLPGEVSEQYALDYQEAVAVLPYSSKASAALSRRCLQNFLNNYLNITTGELASEIKKLLDKNELPSYLARQIDSVRIVGNFAAHPMKSARSLEIHDVEEGEAEYSLDTLLELLSFYFVEIPSRNAKTKAIEEKLKDAEAKKTRR